MFHNSTENNKRFKQAWDETNARYIADTKWAIINTFKRRHESKHVKQACKDNITFFRNIKI